MQSLTTPWTWIGLGGTKREFAPMVRQLFQTKGLPFVKLTGRGAMSLGVPGAQALHIDGYELAPLAEPEAATSSAGAAGGGGPSEQHEEDDASA